MGCLIFAVCFHCHDMTFHPEEIAQMLGDYENDVHKGMDIKAISEEIYKYTNGYPFLVSAICKLIDERLDKEWTADGVLHTVKIISKGENVTLLDDLSKNTENIPERSTATAPCHSSKRRADCCSSPS